MNQLRNLLAENPDVEVSSPFATEVDQSVAYLASSAALESLKVDSYWPKWNSPWWHMVVLHEMGLAERIPERLVQAMVEALNSLPVKFFPLRADEVPQGVGSSCHCAVGSIYAVLSAHGVNVGAEVPWLREWLPRYQMTDGGMSCDNDAYLVEGECPSSMVALVPVFEAVLHHVSDWTPEEERFLDRGADFLIARQLRLGSSSQHNAAERDSAPAWLEPCFPRLYLYDVLRGLHGLLSWAWIRGRTIPFESVSVVLEHLLRLTPDGLILIGRRSYDGIPTRLPGLGRGPASHFPLLTAASHVGAVSPFLTRQWTECKRLLRSRELIRDPDPAGEESQPATPVRL